MFIKKIFLILLVIFINIDITNAWVGLTAENGDLLNVIKWNELVNDKLSKVNLKAGSGIILSNLGDDIFINLKGEQAIIPYISDTDKIFTSKNNTYTLIFNGYNFTPFSNFQIKNFDGTIDSTNIISPVKLEVEITTGNTEGEYDIIVSNGDFSNTLWSNNGKELLVVGIIGIVGDDTNGRKYEDGNFANTCNDYLNSSGQYEYDGDIGDGIYWIKPDSNQSEFKVYCDMTTGGGGWTRFVDIKGNYTLQNGIDCWLGSLSNNNIECFNPNRYGIVIANLMNIDWSGNYSYTMIDQNPSVTTETSNNSRKCLGHSEYMTIMRSDTTPQNDGSDTQYVRLGRSFCEYGRDPAGRGGSFMNYDSSGDFGESSNAGRESSARNTEMYFR